MTQWTLQQSSSGGLIFHSDSKTKDEYTALLARYERFTQAADK